MKFTNLLSVITYFADKQKATEHLIKLRWANGVINCPHCGETKIYTLKGATKRFKCGTCREQFSATKGTIFENSAIPLQKWFAAIYLHTSHKKGISSHQLAKDLGITQKSAWFMLQRIRYALQSGSFNHTDGTIVQMDETFVGGKAKNKHGYRSHWTEGKASPIFSAKAKKVDDKTPVVGIVQTNGNVIAERAKDVSGKTLYAFLAKHVNKETVTVVTDHYSVYRKLSQMGYSHVSVNHLQGEYVVNGFHTNGIENFWSHFKRGIIGVYHHASDKHLDKYIDEFEFRYNTRKMSEINRFDKMLTLCNRRLTYNELIAEHEETTGA